jgi:hypothetical protein
MWQGREGGRGEREAGEKGAPAVEGDGSDGGRGEADRRRRQTDGGGSTTAADRRRREMRVVGFGDRFGDGRGGSTKSLKADPRCFA